VYWFPQNNLLPDGEQSSDGSSYTILNADRHAAGHYLCTGNNGVGPPVATGVEVKVQCENNWILSTCKVDYYFREDNKTSECVPSLQILQKLRWSSQEFMLEKVVKLFSCVSSIPIHL